MNVGDVSREELFALVWERPATEVAQKMGISDVALGKLCRRKQVPKPTRGYWARVQSGQTPKRPPLQAFQAEYEASIKRRKRRQESASGIVKLAKLQRMFLVRGLAELEEHGVTSNHYQLTYVGICFNDPDLVAKLLILIQNRYTRWIEESAVTVQARLGAQKSLIGLVTKLLPLAKEHVVIFKQNEPYGYGSRSLISIIVHLTPALQKHITQLYQAVREHGISYLATVLGSNECAMSANFLHSPSGFTRYRSELCISSSQIWFRCNNEETWGVQEFETTKLPIKQLIPVDLIAVQDIDLSRNIGRISWKPYAERLRALKEAEEIYDRLSTATYDIGQTVPDERLAIMDRLWFGEEGASPFGAARRAWRCLEVDLERWEQVLEDERTELCNELLGVEKKSIVVVEKKSKLIRIELTRTDISVNDETVLFHLSGKRFRKDGLPGKREEYFTLQVANDL